MKRAAAQAERGAQAERAAQAEPPGGAPGQRRSRLARALGETSALICAGSPIPRNFPANLYPFRASSHFLYFLGRSIPGAALLIDEGLPTLFAPRPDPRDALWSGEAPSLEALSRELGCPVLPIDRLEQALEGRSPGTIAAPDATTRDWQRAALGRDPGSSPSEADSKLVEAIVQLRLVHDARAQGGLRRAALATGEAHLEGMRATRVGLSERDVRAAMEAALMRRGATTAYASIVTTHGEILHCNTYEHPLRAGDLLLADVGAEVEDGWAGDVTRTWPVSGSFSPTQRDAYALVLEAQRRAIAKVAPGRRYRDVHLEACRAMAEGLIALGILRGDPDELVADGVHALVFPHGIGHLLGLDVHDMEDLGDRAGYPPGRGRAEQFGLCYLRLDRDLEPGMAVTIEPGWYRLPALLEDPGLSERLGDRLDREALARFDDVRGIRIEDDLLVTSEGAENLSEGIPKSLEAVEAMVGALA
ncbi:MAG: aminopeptidase P family protein [Myxococcales bacterium]|nr:aminopeptidase P family protein [Myxococcales bacterium]